VQNYNKKTNLPPFGGSILPTIRQIDINQCQIVSTYYLGTSFVGFLTKEHKNKKAAPNGATKKYVLLFFCQKRIII
jgi:hypothetical protein